jgi:hypothetical protein
MGWAGSMHGKHEVDTKFYSVYLKGAGHLGEVSAGQQNKIWSIEIGYDIMKLNSSD